MKFEELRNQSETELKTLLESTNQELFQLRMKNALRQLDNPSQIRQLRHRVAQITTLLNEKNRVQAVGGSTK
jgi:large subunit ribosomal protein L29